MRIQECVSGAVPRWMAVRSSRSRSVTGPGSPAPTVTSPSLCLTRPTGVITAAEGEELARGLDRVAERLAAGEAPTAADEDVHTFIDRLLHEVTGGAPAAGKLHTGRSRND